MAWIYKIGVGVGLTQAQRENNATEFYNFFTDKGATLESICGMLGNINWESGINPGNKQGSSTELGWGLIQWTPATTLINWCNKYKYKWYDGAAQCDRIWCEGTRTKGISGVWLPTSAYPYSWSEFLNLADVNEATKAYLYERERASAERLEERLEYASQWYEYFSGSPVPPVPPTPTLKKSMPIYMMLRRL